MTDFLQIVRTEIPAPLQERLLRYGAECLQPFEELLAAEPGLAAELVRVWACSDFVAQSCLRDASLLCDLVASGDLFNRYPTDAYTRRLESRLAEVREEAALAAQLRRLRRREMVRIAWRDLSGRAALGEVMADLSALADACVDGALVRLYDWHCAQWGTPCSAAGEPQRLVVLGMGKLGARELNFSSDIDLILAYPEEGETRGARRSISNQEFFVRLAQRLANALNTATADGYVFRVDLRLRPFGESSPTALSFDAMELYYQTHGREWERYAMIKARVVAGDKAAGKQLLETLKPFVYRRYIDFGVFESLREMKGMIEREVQRKGLEDNIKLGAGGIREVEFIGQAFQLIRGGREPALQTPRLSTVLEALRGFGLLPEFVVDELTTAYTFLRMTEHRLQEFADQQTHSLPGDALGRARLAFAMGYGDWPAFETALRRHMRRVHSHFEQVFAAPQRADGGGDGPDLSALWLGEQEEGQSLAALAALGFSDPAEALRRLQQLHASHAYRALSGHGRQRMDRLLPLAVGAAAGSEGPDLTLQRLLEVIEKVGRRTAYLALLVENPMALSQLVRLCAASSWIANLLARHPLLLDELLDPRILYAPPSRKELQNELRQRLLQIPPDDLEQQMDALRHFKQANVLRVAAADVAAAMPLMVVSDHLTWIAEVVLEEVVELAWRQLVARHGRPLCTAREVCDKGFAVIAYGKLGGIELGYGSDLDLVFLHHSDDEGRPTDGPKPIPASMFFARLAQRIVHILNTATPAGVLYEVDLRLRPSGSSGLLVSSLEAFADYQRNHAWTWEHQALVRARPVAGDAALAGAFAAIRAEILSRERPPESLRAEVRQMRERMRRELLREGEARFDLKQGAGGIADIEFMVQYGVLAWAHAHPPLLEYTDNIRLLQTLAGEGIMPAAHAEALIDAYRAYRAQVHRLTLQDQPALVGGEMLGAERAAVTGIWREWMEK